MTGLGGQSAATDSALVGPERIAWPENGRFRVKNMNDGPKVLNLACGTKMHRAWNNLDPDVSAEHYPRRDGTSWLDYCQVLLYRRDLRRVQSNALL